MGLLVKENMNLAKWPIFRAGLFKQTKYLVSTPQKAQHSLKFTETGVIGIEPLPIPYTGFMQSGMIEVKKAWANVRMLALQIYKDGQPTDKAAVIPISERSYKPLDPLGLMNKVATEKLASLKDIAQIRHKQERAAVGLQDNNKDLAAMIIQICGILLGLYAVLTFVRGC